MSIYPECDSDWSSREYLDSSHDKKNGSIGRVSSRDETGLFDEAFNALDGYLGCNFFIQISILHIVG